MFGSILTKKKTKKKERHTKKSHSFFLANWLGSDIAIDLGTANIIVYVKKRGIVVNEPAVIAVDKNTNKVIAIGKEAHAMLERTPEHIDAYHPMQNGVIADYDATEYMLRYFIRKAIGNALLFKPRVIICVPSSVTNVERRAVMEAAMQAEPFLKKRQIARLAFLLSAPRPRRRAPFFLLCARRQCDGVGGGGLFAQISLITAQF